MEQLIITIGVILIALAAIIMLGFHLQKRSSRGKTRTVSILSSIQFSDEDLDAETEIRELRSRRHRFYRISGFKWILSFLLAVILLFLATFEFWIAYYPEPEIGHLYPITLKAAYQFEHQGTTFRKGTVLITRGDLVRADEIGLVRAYAENRKYPSFLQLLGYFVLFLSFTLFLIYWLLLFLPEPNGNTNKDLVFIFLTILLVVAVAKFSFLTALLSMYFVPLAMLAMLITILIFNRIVPSVTVFAAFFVAIVSEFNIQLLMVLFGGSMVTLFWLQKVKKRSQVISAGLTVGIINLLIFAGIELTRESFFISEMFKENAFAAFANGILCGFLSLLLIPFFEKAFGYVSPFRMMELADLDSDLMRELYLKAPGTYHHSLAVANLAEIAANEIGADALLLRVGAYYHDIGKMFKPKFFVENIGQAIDNPHNKISPYASSKVLKSHVTLGLELGEKYGLPRKILDLIPQHHGTTVMDYFFDKARQTAENGSISDKYFSYPGPRPQTKEASILMIVDSVEAASRVLVDNSEETVQKMIEKLINHKLEQKQLDEAPLTVAELRRITYALTKALSTSTHKRIDYPERSGGISAQFSASNPEQTSPPKETVAGAPYGTATPAEAAGEAEKASAQETTPLDNPVPSSTSKKKE